jgi:hypothetical protein
VPFGATVSPWRTRKIAYCASATLKQDRTTGNEYRNHDFGVHRFLLSSLCFQPWQQPDFLAPNLGHNKEQSAT